MSQRVKNGQETFKNFIFFIKKNPGVGVSEGGLVKDQTFSGFFLRKHSLTHSSLVIIGNLHCLVSSSLGYRMRTED